MEYFGTVCLPICFSIMRRVLWVRATRTLIQCSDYDTRCAHEFREAPGVRCFSTAFEKQIGSLCRATPDDRGARSIHLNRRSATEVPLRHRQTICGKTGNRDGVTQHGRGESFHMAIAEQNVA